MTRGRSTKLFKLICSELLSVDIYRHIHDWTFGKVLASSTNFNLNHRRSCLLFHIIPIISSGISYYHHCSKIAFTTSGKKKHIPFKENYSNVYWNGQKDKTKKIETELFEKARKERKLLLKKQ